MRPLLAVLALTMLAARLHAHEVRPAYLELHEAGDGTWDVLFKVPARGDMKLSLQARLPEHCQVEVPVRRDLDGSAYRENWVVRCPGGVKDISPVLPGSEPRSTATSISFSDPRGTICNTARRSRSRY